MKNPLTYHYRGYRIDYLGTPGTARVYQVETPTAGGGDRLLEFSDDCAHTDAIADIKAWIDVSDPGSPAG